MKKLIAIALVIVAVAALFCACGEEGETKTTGPVTTTVKAQYDDGYASNYASNTTTDDDGNRVYEFSGEQYDAYVENHRNTISSEIQRAFVDNHDKKYGEYAYIKDDANSIIVGLHDGEYDAEIAEKDAEKAAQLGFKYFQSLQKPVDTIKVVYCNAGDQNSIYGSFDYTLADFEGKEDDKADAAETEAAETEAEKKAEE